MNEQSHFDKFGASSFRHVGWFTPDIEGSVKFWTSVMGYQAGPIEVRRGAWLGKMVGVAGAQIRVAHLKGHGGHIEFIQFDEPKNAVDFSGSASQTAHICLKLKNVEGLCGDILANGGSLKGEFTEITEGVSSGLRGIYVRDPHGITIELIEI